MLPVRTVHVHLVLQPLDNITAVLLQDTELFPQDPAELMSCDAVVYMACELVHDRLDQLFRRAGVNYFSSGNP